LPARAPRGSLIPRCVTVPVRRCRWGALPVLLPVPRWRLLLGFRRWWRRRISPSLRRVVPGAVLPLPAGAAAPAPLASTAWGSFASAAVFVIGPVRGSVTLLELVPDVIFYLSGTTWVFRLSAWAGGGGSLVAWVALSPLAARRSVVFPFLFILAGNPYLIWTLDSEHHFHPPGEGGHFWR